MRRSTGSDHPPTRQHEHPIKFKVPGASAYTDITADTAATDNNVVNYYSHFKNVTSIVSAAGSGTYTVADIVSSSEMGWALVVVLADPAKSPKTMVIYDGSLRVSAGVPYNDRSVTVGGFLTPPCGTVTSTVGIFSVQGESILTGDSAIFGGTTLSDSLNPSSNFFNGTYTKFGSTMSNINPNTVAHYNVDLDLVELSGVLGNSQTSTNFRFTSSGDFYIPMLLTVTIETYVPNLNGSFTKGVIDLNGGSLQPGDAVYYEFSLENIGNDTASSTVFYDVVPSGMTYIPGTLEILSGAGAAVLTDATGDDQGEVSGSSVTVRIGTGASGASGGTLSVGEKTRLRFAARVNNDAQTNSQISNAASISLTGVSSGSSFTFQSEAIIGGIGGDSLLLNVGSAVPTPAFTPVSQQYTPTPLTTATFTPSPISTATSTTTPSPTPTSSPTRKFFHLFIRCSALRGWSI